MMGSCILRKTDYGKTVPEDAMWLRGAACERRFKSAALGD